MFSAKRSDEQITYGNQQNHAKEVKRSNLPANLADKHGAILAEEAHDIEAAHPPEIKAPETIESEAENPAEEANNNAVNELQALDDQPDDNTDSGSDVSEESMEDSSADSQSTDDSSYNDASGEHIPLLTKEDAVSLEELMARGSSKSDDTNEESNENTADDEFSENTTNDESDEYGASEEDENALMPDENGSSEGTSLCTIKYSNFLIIQT